MMVTPGWWRERLLQNFVLWTIFQRRFFGVGLHSKKYLTYRNFQHLILIAFLPCVHLVFLTFRSYPEVNTTRRKENLLQGIFNLVFSFSLQCSHTELILWAAGRLTDGVRIQWLGPLPSDKAWTLSESSLGKVLFIMCLSPTASLS